MFEIPPLLLAALIGVVGSVCTGIVTYLGTKKKNNTDAFTAIIEANEKFREEVRADLAISKAETQGYKDMVNNLNIQISEYEYKVTELTKQTLEYKDVISNLNEQIIKYEKQINALVREISEYKDAIRELKSEISKLNTNKIE